LTFDLESSFCIFRIRVLRITWKLLGGAWCTFTSLCYDGFVGTQYNMQKMQQIWTLSAATRFRCDG